MITSSFQPLYPQDLSRLIEARCKDKAIIDVQLCETGKDQIFFTTNKLLLERINKIEGLKGKISSLGIISCIPADLALQFLVALDSETRTDKIAISGFTLTRFLNDLEKNKKINRDLKDHFCRNIKHETTVEEYTNFISRERNFAEAYRYARHLASNGKYDDSVNWLYHAKVYLGKNEKFSDRGCDLDLIFKGFLTIKTPTVFLDPEIRKAATDSSITSIELECDLTMPIVEGLADFIEKTKTLKKLELRGGKNRPKDLAEYMKKIATALEKNSSVTEIHLDQAELLDEGIENLLESIKNNRKSLIQKLTFDGCWKITQKSYALCIDTLKKCQRIIDVTFQKINVPQAFRRTIAILTERNKAANAKKETLRPKKRLKEREPFNPTIFTQVQTPKK